ncbi:hypothetical protein AB0901_03945 [Streptomyces roseifaciens]
MTHESNAPDPTTVYAEAPSIVSEICWLLDQNVNRPFGTEQGRDFWLRKAAVLDRIAIEEAATYAPPVAANAVETAEEAARRLVEYDVTHSGLSLKGSDVITGDDCRAYVRREYDEWSRTQLL